MKVGMIFPGYGTQFVGMSKELYDNSRTIQEYFEEASNCLNINFVKLCFASSDIELSKIVHAYPALFLVSLATAKMLKEEFDVQVHYVAGHGIGEYSALSFAGGISFPDGLYLIAKLAQFYVQIREHLDLKSVVVSGITSNKLKQICKEQNFENPLVQIAIYETKTEHIVTGHSQAIDGIIQKVSSTGIKKVKITDLAENGLHTTFVEELFEKIKIYLNKVDFKDLSIPLVSSIDGKQITTAKKAEDSIMNQIIKPIYWTNVLNQFSDADLIIIPAPAQMLVSEIRTYFPNKLVVGIDTLSDIDNLKNIIVKMNDTEKEIANSSNYYPQAENF